MLKRLFVSMGLGSAFVGGVLLTCSRAVLNPADPAILRRTLTWIALPLLRFDGWGESDEIYWPRVALSALLWIVVVFFAYPLIREAWSKSTKALRDGLPRRLWQHRLLFGVALIALAVIGTTLYVGSDRRIHGRTGSMPTFHDFVVYNETGHQVRVGVWVDGALVLVRDIPATRGAWEAFKVPEVTRFPYTESKVLVGPRPRALTVEETLSMKKRRTFSLNRFERQGAGTYLIRIGSREIQLMLGGARPE